MNNAYYMKILVAELEKLVALMKQRGAIDVQSAKCEEFISATINMLSEEKRDEFRKTLEAIKEASRDRDANLTYAIRRVLQEAPTSTFLTVRAVRDRLKGSGFDFSAYTSSPLASISTTLRRMKSEEVEVTDVQGVTAYRWKGVRRYPRTANPHSPVIAAYLRTSLPDDASGYSLVPPQLDEGPSRPKRTK